jgi:hypothetical protein
MLNCLLWFEYEVNPKKAHELKAWFLMQAVFRSELCGSDSEFSLID